MITRKKNFNLWSQIFYSQITGFNLLNFKYTFLITKLIFEKFLVLKISSFFINSYWSSIFKNFFFLKQQRYYFHFLNKKFLFNSNTKISFNSISTVKYKNFVCSNLNPFTAISFYV